MKIILITITAIIVLLIGGSLWSRSLQANNPNVISRNGIHWHPQLSIRLKDMDVPIPANIGVGPNYAGRPSYGNGGMAMTAIHTHDDMPIIHLEFSGLVREDDTRLGKFFEVWGKDMRSFGSNMTMSVNGLPSTEYENFVMHDGDKIELFYD